MIYFTPPKHQVIINNSDCAIALSGNNINVKRITEQLNKIANVKIETKRGKMLSKPILDIFVEGVNIGFVMVSSSLVFLTYSKYVEVKEREITYTTYERAVKKQTKDFNSFFFYGRK